MQKIILNKQRMYRSTRTVLNKYSQVWVNSNPFKTNVNQFDTSLARMEEQFTDQSVGKAATKGKKQLFTNMLDNALLVSGAGFAYASIIGDEKLKGFFKFTKTTLKAGKDKEVYERCKFIAEKAKVIKVKLVDYNVDDAQLNILRDNLKAFDEVINTPNENRKISKTSKEEMFLIVEECDRILEEVIDKLMLAYKKLQPDFYLEYTNARVIGGWKKKK